MKVCNLASGSAGNMTYIKTKTQTFLIDAGISLGEAKRRKPELDLDHIDGIFITHEHDDHVKFLHTVVKKTNAVIYIEKNSFLKIRPDIRSGLVNQKIAYLEGESMYHIGDVDIYTFNLSHDAVNTFGYIFDDGESKFGYFTDTGIFPIRYKSFLSDLDILMIESNHSVEMLQNSSRPYYLINRILSSYGHMSNQACLELLNDVVTNKNHYILLSHISRDCNSYEKLHEELIDKLNLDPSCNIIITSQFKATEVIEV